MKAREIAKQSSEVQRQLAAGTCWRADGKDVDRISMERRDELCCDGVTKRNHRVYPDGGCEVHGTRKETLFRYECNAMVARI